MSNYVKMSSLKNNIANTISILRHHYIERIIILSLDCIWLRFLLAWGYHLIHFFCSYGLDIECNLIPSLFSFSSRRTAVSIVTSYLMTNILEKIWNVPMWVQPRILLELNIENNCTNLNDYLKCKYVKRFIEIRSRYRDSVFSFSDCFLCLQVENLYYLY